MDRLNFKLAGLQSGPQATLNVKNAFGTLEVQEIDEADLATVPSAAPQTTGKGAAPKDMEFTIEDDGTEWFFAVESFFDDMHSMRYVIEDLWELYAAGSIDAGTVAVVSNTAVDLVRRAEAELTASKLKVPAPYDDFEENSLCNLWFFELGFRASLEDGLDHPAPSREHIVPLTHWHEVEESLLLPYRLLTLQASHIQDGSVPITRPPWIGNYDPMLDREIATPQEIHDQDNALLTDMLITLLPYTTFAGTPNDDG